MLNNSRALQVVLANHGLETPLDAAPAKSPGIDRKLKKRLVAEGGRDALRTMRRIRPADEAEWVASNIAFYYVWPDVGRYWRAAWSEIEALSLSRASRIAPVAGGKVRNIKIKTRFGESVQVQTGANSAMSVYELSRSRLGRSP